MIEIFRGPPGFSLTFADSSTFRPYLTTVYQAQSYFALFGHRSPYNRRTQFQHLVHIFAARGVTDDVIKFKYANSTLYSITNPTIYRLWG